LLKIKKDESANKFTTLMLIAYNDKVSTNMTKLKCSKYWCIQVYNVYDTKYIDWICTESNIINSNVDDAFICNIHTSSGLSSHLLFRFLLSVVSVVPVAGVAANDVSPTSSFLALSYKEPSFFTLIVQSHKYHLYNNLCWLRV
jgi:hypothetical protein